MLIKDAIAPVYETREPLVLAGFRESYAPSSRGGIPAQWRRFNFHLGAVPGQIGDTAYGAILLERGERNVFAYMTAVEVAGEEYLPSAFARLAVDARRYAVFRHDGNVVAIHETVRAVYRTFPGLFESERTTDVDFLERYGPEFDFVTGDGGVDIMIPLAD